ncbi:MAG: threonine synthase [Alphaproteobacteria bacterium TMED194]|nr:MAG: threonine synthase [Alphaproteobacteria bacterium TMED194]
MKYTSTREDKELLNFKQVTLKGLASDGGLYVPKNWKQHNLKFSNMDITFEKTAYEIIKYFVGKNLDNQLLKKLISRSYKSFRNKEITTLKQLDKNNYILELYHGPTLAFKDIALQFLGNAFEVFLKKEKKKLTIVGATSGDTGSAAIDAVKNNKFSDIFILHPYKRVSDFQRKQMTTVNSSNVFNIALKGTFDDCQDIIKKLFRDNELNQRLNLGSINSINWTRIMAQITYYIYAVIQINLYETKKISFAVPTGNFGDAYAGYLAKSKLNASIEKIIIATNENDILDRFFKTGKYCKSNVKSTNTPSMDIQVASNFERLLYDIMNEDSKQVMKIMKNFESKNSLSIKKNTNKKILETFKSFSINQNRTLEVIRNIYEKYNIILDPHTAVGFAASLDYLEKNNKEHTVVSLATAHPAKFSNAVLKAIGKKPMLPKKYENIFELEERCEVLDNNYKLVKDFILKNIL